MFLIHFHYFIYLETANTQKSKVLLLRISSGNVNASTSLIVLTKTAVMEKVFC